MAWLGLDIGGANLKAADCFGFAVVRPFALWQRSGELATAIEQLLADAPAVDRLAITMTGELADCFADKTEGVTAIVKAVVQAASSRSIHVYLTDGRWASPEEATLRPLLAAASNWHGLARFAARFLPEETGLLLDIGSTTCDIIPIVRGVPTACGRTDPERMVHGELVYSGVQRTPICALVDRVPWGGGKCPVARELFATTWDAYLLLGDVPEEPSSTHTADGRPATVMCAHARLARLICGDRSMVDRPAAMAIAAAVARAHLEEIVAAVRKVIGRLPTQHVGIVVSGSGEFLARRAIRTLSFAGRVASLREQLGPTFSEAATAYAMAVLASETIPS